MRKRLAIVGHSEEGLTLIPLLEANPDVEVCGVLTSDQPLHGDAGAEPHVEPAPGRALLGSHHLATPLRRSCANGGAPRAWSTPILSPSLRAVRSHEAPDRGLQVTTPLIAKLLYAFGPVDASRKPDLLHTHERDPGVVQPDGRSARDCSQRILQIAVGATGADRGSLMLYDPERGHLAVEVAIGIEKEVLPKIKIAPGEGISGLAFQGRQAILMHGKADQQRYRIVRERDDIESAISAPLIYDDQVIGVLNLSHARQRGAFGQEDLQFVEQLAQLDAKIIARAEEYHTLLRDSAQLRAQAEVRRILQSGGSLSARLGETCAFVSRELEGGICHVYLYDPEVDRMALHSSSTQLDPLASPLRIERNAGLHGFAMRTQKPVVLSQAIEGQTACFAIVPLVARDELLGLLSLEGLLGSAGAELVCERIIAVARALAAELSDALRESRMEREATKMTAITEAASVLNATGESAELFRPGDAGPRRRPACVARRRGWRASAGARRRGGGGSPRTRTSSSGGR